MKTTEELKQMNLKLAKLMNEKLNEDTIYQFLQLLMKEPETDKVELKELLNLRYAQIQKRAATEVGF